MKIDVTINAGQTLEYYDPGDFFRLLEATAPVSITFYKQGKEVSEAENVGEGFAEKFRVGDFDRIRIHSATTQALQFVIRLGADVYYDKPPTGTVVLAGQQGAFANQPLTVSNVGDITLRAAKPTRRYLLIQNQDPASTFNIRFDGASASLMGLKLGPGESIEFQGFVPSEAVIAVGSVASATPNCFVLEG